MKKLWDLIVLTLAINFVALAAGVGWLYSGGRLDRKNLLAVKEVLFPAPVVATPTTLPSEEPGPSTRPTMRLEELLAKHTGARSAGEQVDFLQHSFDAQRVELDQRQRQLEDLQTLVGAAQAKVKADRDALESDRNQLTHEQNETARLAADKGFQDSLNLYNTMPAKQVKSVFLAMDDAAVAQFLQAMQPRSAARIVKEFKAPEEQDRIRRVLDRMRQPQPPTPAPATNPTKEP